MAKKMYYTQEEAAAKVGGASALAELVKQNKLRAYPDGARKVFKVDDVDAIGGTAEVELAPVSEISLTQADTVRPAGKEDTVITAEGISIFDDEDLEIETADPLAKTQIAPSVEDQISLEGVGSGSGLLDLTRESDDTSLGAEVLDHIDMEGQVPSGLQESASVPQVASSYSPQPMMVEPTYVEEADPGAGLFGGMLVGLAIGVLILATTAPAAMHVSVPGFLDWLSENKPAIIGIIVVLAGLCALIGWMMGKSAAQRQAMKRGM